MTTRQAAEPPSSPSGVRRRTPAATRERILAAAERLFAEQGYDRVSMPAIAEASGVTAGAIYRHFPGKAALFFEIVRRAVQATPAAPAGEASLPEIVAAYASRRMKRVRQMAIEMHAASARDATVRRLLRTTLARQIGEMQGAIAASQQAGALDPALDPELAASLLFVVIMGLTHMETLLPGKVGDAAFRAFVADRVAALLGARS
jgi:AcrR family transcriptional regulator